MSCGFDQELISMYADGTIRRDRVIGVEHHISGCDECSSILQDMRHLGAALRSLPRKHAPLLLIDRICAIAEPKIQRTAWNAAKWTVASVFTVAMHGFTIDASLEELLRRESPPWVARWVLFV